MVKETRDGERKSGKKEEEAVKLGVEKRNVEKNRGNGKQHWVLFRKGSDKAFYGRKDRS